MKVLYIDCGMGAAGDMLTAALLELLPDREEFVEKLNNIGIEGVTYTASESVKCGIVGTHMDVKVNGVSEDEHEHEYEHDHEHHHEHEHNHDHHHHHTHRSLNDIKTILDGLKITDKVKNDVLNIYTIIAEAEGVVHGKKIDEIHFHEVGNMDAVADITAVCMLFDELKFDKIYASKINVGGGHVHCAHGILPVPAPATASILKGIPIYSKLNSELCTPTGAAILKYFVNEFKEMPELSIDKIGYGMGKKDFEICNCVRVVSGEIEDNYSNDKISELLVNIDDMTGEEIGYAVGKFLELGALDVYTMPISMKKNRPGTLIGVIVSLAKRDELVKAIFKYTKTLGIRESIKNRYILDRSSVKIDSTFGEVTAKISSGYGVTRTKFEYEELKTIADYCDLSISEVNDIIRDTTL